MGVTPGMLGTMPVNGGGESLSVMAFDSGYPLHH